MSDQSPRSGSKRERDFRRSPNRSGRSPPRYTRFERERSPPRKRRRDEFDRREDFQRRRDPSPDRRREERPKGRDDDSPRRKKNASSDNQKFEGPLLSFKQFSESLDERVGSSLSQKRYEEYKQEYDKKNQRTFFKNHKEEEWFREKYSPANVTDYFKHQTSRVLEASIRFLEELKQGHMDGVSWDADSMEDLLKEETPIIDEHKKIDLNVVADGDIPMGGDAHEDSEPTEKKDEKSDANIKPEDKEKKVPQSIQELFSCPIGQFSMQVDNIPPTLTRAEIFDSITNTVISKSVRLIISAPAPTKNFTRTAWVGYSTEDTLELALTKLKTVTVKEYNFSVSRFEFPKRVKIVPSISNSVSRIQTDLGNARKLVRAFDDHRGIHKNILLERISNSSRDDDSIVALEDKLLKLPEKAQLDLLIAYLLRVHCHLYYTGENFPSFEHLVLTGTPVARPTAKFHCNISQDDSTWEKDLDKKNSDTIAYLSQTNRDLTGETLFESTIEEFYNDKVLKKSKDGEDRFICELCTKAFKAPNFVQKHIQNRHPENINEIREKAMEEQFFKNYISDPSRLTPSMMYTFPEEKPTPKEKGRDDRHKKSPKENEREDKPRKSPQTTRDRSPPRSGDKRSPPSGSRRSPPRDRSPIRRSPRDRSPQRSPRGRLSPGRDRSPRDRSLSPRDRDRPRGGGGRWSPPRRGRDRPRRGRMSGGRGGRRDDFMEEPPAGYKDKIDPRNFVEYTDLDKPPEDNVTIDYEKALQAFASGGL